MTAPPSNRLQLSQEGLKTAACASMLLDHFGAIVVLAAIRAAVSSGNHTGILPDVYELLRTVGRLAFPIYCFLLSEGAAHTRNSGRYASRLVIAVLLSELPFDLALHNSFSWQNQSVMVTLLLGFLALQCMKKCSRLIGKLLVVLPFALTADFLNTDYGANGVILITLFHLTRNLPRKHLWQALGMWFLFSPNHLMVLNWLSGVPVTTQELAVFAIIPISLYSGEKKSSSKLLQWGFYLFYPLHLALLWLVKGLLFA